MHASDKLLETAAPRGSVRNQETQTVRGVCHCRRGPWALPWALSGATRVKEEPLPSQGSLHLPLCLPLPLLISLSRLSLFFFLAVYLYLLSTSAENKALPL